MPERRTIVFFPEPGAWGPTNNCVAIAEVLRERGHRVVFVIDSSFEGVLEERGYEERIIRMAPAGDAAGEGDADHSLLLARTLDQTRVTARPDTTDRHATWPTFQPAQMAQYSPGAHISPRMPSLVLSSST